MGWSWLPIFAVVGWLALCQPAAAVMLLLNGDCETAAPSLSGGTPATTGPTWARSNAAAHSGSWSLRASSTLGASGRYRLGGAGLNGASAGELYRVSCWVSSGSSSSSLGWILSPYGSLGVAGSGGWRKVDTGFVVSSGSTDVDLVVEATVPTLGAIYFDDFTLELVGDPDMGEQFTPNQALGLLVAIAPFFHFGVIYALGRRLLKAVRAIW